MRDIVFRGKEVSFSGFKFWRYGWLCKFNNCPDNKNPMMVTEDGMITCPVYAETVGQYTGLRDRRGKRIFEGDIIKRSGPKGEYANNYLVTFEDGAFMLVWVKELYDKWHQCRPFLIFQDWKEINRDGMVYKIIGNKWDRPKLLEAIR